MDTPLFNARPTIRIDGQDQPALSQGLLSFACVESISGAGECEATFTNWGTIGAGVGYLYFDRSLLDHGKALQIKAGTRTLFDGVIVGLEAQFPDGRPPAIKVLAAASPAALRMTRRTRTFANLTDAALITQIATQHGLTPDINLSGPPHATLEQTDQSDLAFLYDRARRSDTEVWLDGGILHARLHTAPDRTARQLRYGANLSELVMSDELASTRAALTPQVRAVLDQLAAITDGISRPVTSGFRIGSPVTDAPVSNHVVTGHGRTSEVNVLQVGTFVTLQNIGPLFNGDYFTTGVKVLFDLAAGLRVEFDIQR
jgi:uncharacterized protein